MNRVVDPDRVLAYEEAARPASTSDAGRELMGDLVASRRLAAAGLDVLARGAARVATVAALEIAAKSVDTEEEHARAVQVLRGFLAASDPERRADLAAMLEAGLRSAAGRRTAVGLAPLGRRLSGWLDGADETPSPMSHDTSEAVDVTPGDRARFAASAGSGDVDFVLLTSLGIVRDMVALPKRGTAIEGASSLLSRAALGLCVDPPASRAERLDRRWSLVQLGLTLRRRRPLVRAVLRRRLALDRAAWPGPVTRAGSPGVTLHQSPPRIPRCPT